MPKGGKESYLGTMEGHTESKYAAEGKKVILHGGRGVMADGKVTQGEKYPKPDAGASRMAKGMTG